MSDRRILRYEVPVDDQWHTVPLHDTVLEVAARQPHLVELWTIVGEHQRPAPCRLRVYGTGQPLPDNAVHVGTALADDGRLVWHLMEEVAA